MMFIFMSMIMSTIFMFLKHPLSLGTVLMLQTISVSLITGIMNFNFWFSYIVFLIMIGGMLILFLYMTSVASNEKFKLSMTMTTTIMIIVPTMIISTMIMKFINLEFNTKFDIFSHSQIFYSNNSLMKYFNFPSSMIYFIMIIYLLIALITVVFITNVKSGPIRQKF
uniref:NADH-ubiquinone oxidoreductase chain 6 n=1 Tax=Disteniidae sp. BMNH 899837 TaxID=1903814 RepID=A0A343A4F4_9CUCU|nr:NADH dehydrogenase subunit 6 [Disteniidae sp. BMNH 899837]